MASRLTHTTHTLSTQSIVTDVIHTSVGPLVGGQVVRPGEHLAAHSAAVRLVAGVEPHVAAEHVAPSKCPLTHLTQIRLRVRVCTVSRARLKWQIDMSLMF